MGLSISLDIATRALRAQQLGVDVVAHNIANANTPGFSRQELRLKAAVLPPSGFGRTVGLGRAGLGVDASDVRRLRDKFVDFQIREVLQSLGRFDAEARGLEQAEVILHEPGESGLAALMTNFWNAWRDLSNAPESAAARANVLAESGTMISSLRRAHDQLKRLQNDLDADATVTVSEINGLAREVAGLNVQIVRVRVTGANAADLEDQRDLALDRMAQLVNTTVREAQDGAVSVMVGSRELVAGGRFNLLAMTPDAANLGYGTVRWADDGVAAEISAGELAGKLQARDSSVAQRVTDLNTLVAAVITQINAAHQTGYGLDNTTGENFFTGTDAADIALNPVLAADGNKIATASGLSLPGDASAALAIADLQNTLTMNGGTATFDDFYTASVGRLGVAIREARNIANNQDFLRKHLNTLRDSVAGVSLDEEMTNLIKFQRGFEAAARLITVVDSMLDTLVNRTGIVGR